MIQIHKFTYPFLYTLLPLLTLSPQNWRVVLKILYVLSEYRNRDQMTYNEHRITPRELEILFLIAEEYSNKEIAKQLHISIGTVESHRKSLFYKLDAKNMAGLIHKAYKIGLFKTK